MINHLGVSWFFMVSMGFPWFSSVFHGFPFGFPGFSQPTQGVPHVPLPACHPLLHRDVRRGSETFGGAALGDLALGSGLATGGNGSWEPMGSHGNPRKGRTMAAMDGDKIWEHDHGHGEIARMCFLLWYFLEGGVLWVAM